MLQADSLLFNKQSTVYPAQLAAIDELTQGLSHKIQGEAKGFSNLLQGMLHPQAQARMTASKMYNLKWLRDAAKAALPKCPVCMSCPVHMLAAKVTTHGSCKLLVGCKLGLAHCCLSHYLALSLLSCWLCTLSSQTFTPEVSCKLCCWLNYACFSTFSCVI